MQSLYSDFTDLMIDDELSVLNNNFSLIVVGERDIVKTCQNTSTFNLTFITANFEKNLRPLSVQVFYLSFYWVSLDSK